ncbi:MAG: DEAD/DEAH box helicase [Hyphomonadaceae bacterium]|nr:DEAD/DEAH box helicase [Hyphomonadaceae bacterium]
MSSDTAPEGAENSTTPSITFDDLGLSPDTLRAVKETGYNTPTPIQAAAIPEVLKGRDVLGIAQTGTGKTASFTLPMIDILASGRSRARMPRTLILEPTRELAAQVAEAFDKYGKYQKLTKALLIGGVSFGDQDALLARGVDVLIATPGRLLDHFERGKLLLTGVQVMVVDEADRMLDMGFIPDIERIFKLTPFTRQTLFFSATMPPEITRLTEQFLSSPKRIEATRPAMTASTIDQRIIPIPGGDPRTRRAALRAALTSGDVKNGIIFCNRKTDVDVVALSLKRHGFNASPLHGDLEQSLRTKTLDRFRSGELQFLIASDVAARGLDIPDVSHVFNYDLPWQGDDYVHRIGRTGRAGKSGYAASLVTAEDLKLLKEIEKITGEPAVWLGDAPTEDDYANAGKRRRGRGGRGGDARRPGGERGRGEAKSEGRAEGRRDGGRGGDRNRSDRPHSERSQSDRPRSEQPRRVDRGEGLRHEFTATAGSEASVPVADDAPQPRVAESRPAPRPERAPRPESGEPRHSDRGRAPRPPREDREPRGGERESRTPRGDRPPREPRERTHEQRPERNPQPPQRHRDQPRDRDHREARPQRDAQPQHRDTTRHAGGEPPRQSRVKPAGSAPGGSGGFADNVPAFLRKSARPVKVASE